MDNERKCENCKWCHKQKVGDDWDKICVNGDSEHVADWVEYEDSCNCFEKNSKGGEEEWTIRQKRD